MSILTDDMKRVVREQRLGYIATVCPDGTPNLSPKATMKVWDDDHLVFDDSVRRPAKRGSIPDSRDYPCFRHDNGHPRLAGHFSRVRRRRYRSPDESAVGRVLRVGERALRLSRPH